MGHQAIARADARLMESSADPEVRKARGARTPLSELTAPWDRLRLTRR